MLGDLSGVAVVSLMHGKGYNRVKRHEAKIRQTVQGGAKKSTHLHREERPVQLSPFHTFYRLLRRRILLILQRRFPPI